MNQKPIGSPRPTVSKWLWIVLIIVILIACVFYWRFLKNKNQTVDSSNSQGLIMISHHPAGKEYSYLQIMLPSGWISVPDNVGGFGFGPINFFNSKSDEQIFISHLNDSSTSDSLFVNARTISGVVLDKKINDLTKMDAVLKSNSDYKVLVDNKVFDGGDYRCYQGQNNNQIVVTCWVNYSTTAVNFILTTFVENYQSDLQSFYKTIESLKFY